VFNLPKMASKSSSGKSSKLTDVVFMAVKGESDGQVPYVQHICPPMDASLDLMNLVRQRRLCEVTSERASMLCVAMLHAFLLFLASKVNSA
jgi:hypothetical protein